MKAKRKKRQSFGTMMQKKAVELMIQNGGNAGKAMREAGYSERTSLTPQNLTESAAYKDILASYGLTEGLVTKALVRDIKSKPGRRVKELDLGADILHMKKRDGNDSGGNVTNVFVVFGEKPKEPKVRQYGFRSKVQNQASTEDANPPIQVQSP